MATAAEMGRSSSRCNVHLHCEATASNPSCAPSLERLPEPFGEVKQSIQPAISRLRLHLLAHEPHRLRHGAAVHLFSHVIERQFPAIGTHAILNDAPQALAFAI